MYIISNQNKNKFIQLVDSKPALTLNINDAQVWEKESKVNNFLSHLAKDIKSKDTWEIYKINKAQNFYDDIALNDIIHNNQSKNKRVKLKSNIRKAVYKRTEGHCALCGKFVDYDDYTIDHIVPLSKGGTNDIDNLQCTCKTCNNIKTDILPDEFMEKLIQIVSYNMNRKYKNVIKKQLLKSLLKVK